MQINNLTIKKLEQEITTLSENNLDYLFKLGTFNQIKRQLPRPKATGLVSNLWYERQV